MRVKQLHDEDVVRTFLRDVQVKPLAFTIDSFMLMKSVLTPTGPVYTVLKEICIAMSNDQSPLTIF